MKHLVFLYGNTKKGFPRHATIANDSFRYLGIARTGGEVIPEDFDRAVMYKMVLYSGQPSLVKYTGDIRNCSGVYGELYEVHDSSMTHLDSLEGVEKGDFGRENISITDIQLCNLATDPSVLQSIKNKRCLSFVFKKDAEGAKDLGELWTR